MKLSFLVTKTADGYPVIHTTKCDVILPSLSVDLHGSRRLNANTCIFMFNCDV